MYIFDLSKVLMQKLHFDYIKNKYANKSQLLFTNDDILTYKLKPKRFMKILVRMKKCFSLAIIDLSQNIIVIQTNQLLIR